jgi:hypothetical protein
MKRNATVCLTRPEDLQYLAPGVTPATGTLRTLYGLRVIETKGGSYVSEDLHFEAVRFYKGRDGIDWSGWIVRETMGKDHSDPIATKREALTELVRWAKQDAEERAARIAAFRR